MRCEPRLGSEFDASLLGCSAPGTSEYPASFVLGEGRQECEDAFAERRGEVEPLPIRCLEGRSTCRNALNYANVPALSALPDPIQVPPAARGSADR
jgi:hypothetical protein